MSGDISLHERCTPSSSIGDLYEELCECNVCLQLMKDPRTLHCEHSFCKECLEELVEFKDDSTPFITCPCCRTDCILGAGETVSSLKAQLILKKLLDKVDESTYNKSRKDAEDKLSPKCCDQSIEWYCSECKKFCCNKCINSHCLSCVDLYPIRYSQRFDSFAFLCGKHNSFHTYGCLDCATTFCSYCLYESHTKLNKKCNIVSIRDYTRKFKNPLTEKILLMQNYNRNHESILEQIKYPSSHLKLEEKKFKKYIKEKKMVVLSQMLFMLELTEQEIISNFHNELKEFENNNFKLTSEIQFKIDSVQKVLENSEALAEKSFIELISQTKCMLDQFYSILPEEILEKETNLPEFKFKMECKNEKREIKNIINDLYNTTKDAFGGVELSTIDGGNYNSIEKALNIKDNAIDYCTSMFTMLNSPTDAEKYVLQCLKELGFVKVEQINKQIKSGNADKGRENVICNKGSNNTDCHVFGAIPTGYESFVNVYEDDESSSIEIPCNTDGTLSLSNIQGCFSDATGLKFKSVTGKWKNVRLVNGTMHPPGNSWGERNYCVSLKASVLSTPVIPVIDNDEDTELQMLERHKHYFEEATAQGFKVWICQSSSKKTPDIKLFIARYSSALKANKCCTICDAMIADSTFCLQCWMHLCPKCYEEGKTSKEHRVDHKIVRLNCSCDGCGAYIINTDKQCNWCLDINLCLLCYKSNRFPSRHSIQHPMTTLKLISEEDSASTELVEGSNAQPNAQSGGISRRRNRRTSNANQESKPHDRNNAQRGGAGRGRGMRGFGRPRGLSNKAHQRLSSAFSVPNLCGGNVQLETIKYLGL